MKNENSLYSSVDQRIQRLNKKFRISESKLMRVKKKKETGAKLIVLVKTYVTGLKDLIFEKNDRTKKLYKNTKNFLKKKKRKK